MISAGNYKAIKVTDCFMGMSKKEIPFWVVSIELENKENIDWIVYLHNNFSHEKSKEIAEQNMETLIKLGFQGNSFTEMADGSAEKLFTPFNDDVKVVVDLEDYEKKNGEKSKRPYIKFINFGSGYNKADKSQIVAATKGMVYDSLYARAKNKLGSTTVKTDSNFSQDEIPF